MKFFRQEYWSGLPFSSPGESSRPRDQTRVSHIAGRGFTVRATRGIELDYCDIEWFALTNRDLSVVLRLHPSTAFRTLVDHDGYSISSKGFLPTAIDITVI